MAIPALQNVGHPIQFPRTSVAFESQGGVASWMCDGPLLRTGMRLPISPSPLTWTDAALVAGSLPGHVLAELVETLAREAASVDERRLLVIAGDRGEGVSAAERAIDAGGYDPAECAHVGEPAEIDVERIAMDRTGELLGSTHDAVVFDAHERLDPNALGRTVGTVDGGGLFVLLAPPLDDWPHRRDGFDETIAVPPYDVDEVTGHFKQWFVGTLRSHPGIAIVDVDDGRVERDGSTTPAPRTRMSTVEIPEGTAFPRAVYDACVTTDQARAVTALESLSDPHTAVVVESDRGRGKSSAAGLAGAALAVGGSDVIVTAPSFESTAAVFERADELVDALGERAESPQSDVRGIETSAGGRLRFARPAEAIDAAPDVLLVDEAAAIPVSRLTGFLDVGRVGFTTTIHGYEGAGRGFSIRFREALAASDLDVTDVSLAEPIRYAAGDPVEVWSFRALLLDASPAVEPLVTDATPESVAYRPLEPSDLLADEPLLREVFGLLVLAHYRTEPADLARLLDAPNVSIRALLEDGHVAAVALLAREGGLSADRRARMYTGERVRGNMLPDVLTSQLRDEAAGIPVGLRVMRIATHAAVRSRGLGSHLLDRIREEFADSVDWLGAGYGATPRLLSFWSRNGYSTVHLSIRRNAASGEHSAIMLAPTSDAGRDLQHRHSAQFTRRIPAVLGDTLSDLDPDVVRAALDATEATVPLHLDEPGWRFVVAAAYGPGLVDLDPGPFRQLALRHLIDPEEPDALTPRQERLLVMKSLQARGWAEVAAVLGFPSRRTCMQALGKAYRPLVDTYGTPAALSERDRYR